MSTPVSVAAQIDRFCDLVPGVSAITNLVHLFFKCVVFPLQKGEAAVGSYRAYLEKKPVWQCVVLGIFGGFAQIFIWIFQKPVVLSAADPAPSVSASSSTVVGHSKSRLTNRPSSAVPPPNQSFATVSSHAGPPGGARHRDGKESGVERHSHGTPSSAPASTHNVESNTQTGIQRTTDETNLYACITQGDNIAELGRFSQYKNLWNPLKLQDAFRERWSSYTSPVTDDVNRDLRALCQVTVGMQFVQQLLQALLPSREEEGLSVPQYLIEWGRYESRINLVSLLGVEKARLFLKVLGRWNVLPSLEESVGKQIGWDLEMHCSDTTRKLQNGTLVWREPDVKIVESAFSSVCGDKEVDNIVELLYTFFCYPCCIIPGSESVDVQTGNYWSGGLWPLSRLLNWEACGKSICTHLRFNPGGDFDKLCQALANRSDRDFNQWKELFFSCFAALFKQALDGKVDNPLQNTMHAMAQCEQAFNKQLPKSFLEEFTENLTKMVGGSFLGYFFKAAKEIVEHKKGVNIPRWVSFVKEAVAEIRLVPPKSEPGYIQPALNMQDSQISLSVERFEEFFDSYCKYRSSSEEMPPASRNKLLEVCYQETCIMSKLKNQLGKNAQATQRTLGFSPASGSQTSSASTAQSASSSQTTGSARSAGTSSSSSNISKASPATLSTGQSAGAAAVDQASSSSASNSVTVSTTTTSSSTSGGTSAPIHVTVPTPKPAPPSTSAHTSTSVSSGSSPAKASASAGVTRSSTAGQSPSTSGASPNVASSSGPSARTTAASNSASASSTARVSSSQSSNTPSATRPSVYKPWTWSWS